VFIDGDGVRRRIFLAQKVGDHWYLQLAFAPLMEYLGNPEIRLEKRRLILRNARIPNAPGTPAGDASGVPVGDTAGTASASGTAADTASGDAAGTASGTVAAAPAAPPRDIVIPLDTGGRMMLDWPLTDFRDSFTHLSFAKFSRLEELESLMEQYRAGLETADAPFFVQFDQSLYPVSAALRRTGDLFRAAREEQARALEEGSGEAFSRSVAFRTEGMALLRDLSGMGGRVLALAEDLGRDYPEDAGAIREEAEYISGILSYLETALAQYGAAADRVREAVAGKFCIVGRVDTGTTDIGVNPFYKEYVNVGTHAVLMDTVLSRSFITPLHPFWSAALCLLLTPLLILGLSGLKPASRPAWERGAPSSRGA
jgi:adenylate cyclase